MDSTSEARLVLMCGLPGSGKTTLARHLAEDLRAVRLCPDEWLQFLGADLHDEATRDRVEALFWDHAQALLRLGQSDLGVGLLPPLGPRREAAGRAGTRGPCRAAIPRLTGRAAVAAD